MTNRNRGSRYHPEKVLSRTRTYQSWCRLRKTGEYVKRWEDYLNFLEDMGEQPANTIFMRKKRGHPYSKENCTYHPYTNK